MNSLFTILFYFFAAITLLSGLLILFTKNVIYAATGLLFSLLGVAAIFVFANAEFLAVTQIVIYAGGVLILIIFGVMLSKRTKKEIEVISQTRNVLAGALVASAIISFLVWAIINQWGYKEYSTVDALTSAGYVEEIGVSLMTTFVLPFEIIAILLLVALVGAAKIATAKEEEVLE